MFVNATSGNNLSLHHHSDVNTSFAYVASVAAWLSEISQEVQPNISVQCSTAKLEVYIYIALPSDRLN